MNFISENVKNFSWSKSVKGIEKKDPCYVSSINILNCIIMARFTEYFQRNFTINTSVCGSLSIIASFQVYGGTT